MEILLILYLASGTLLVLLSLPLLFEKIRPNPLYGFRVPQTLDTPEVWYTVNKHAAKWLIFAGASFVLTSIILYFIPSIGVDAYALGCLAVFVIVFTVAITQSVRYMRTLLK
jgi:uncharacterized membrane protein